MMSAIIAERLRYELKGFLDNEIIPILGDYSRGDPLETLSTDTVCSLLNVSKPTIRRLIQAKELPVIRLGKGKRAPLRIRRIDLQNYLTKKSNSNEK